MQIRIARLVRIIALALSQLDGSVFYSIGGVPFRSSIESFVFCFASCVLCLESCVLSLVSCVLSLVSCVLRLVSGVLSLISPGVQIDRNGL